MPKLLPAKFLNKGYHGPAVAALQLFLIGRQDMHLHIVDGVYGDDTAEAVTRLQTNLGFEAEAIDGNFGPQTRGAVRHIYGIDFDAIDRNIFEGETHAVTP